MQTKKIFFCMSALLMSCLSQDLKEALPLSKVLKVKDIFVDASSSKFPYVGDFDVIEIDKVELVNKAHFSFGCINKAKKPSIFIKKLIIKDISVLDLRFCGKVIIESQHIKAQSSILN